MNLSQQSVICLAATRNTAELIVNQLRFHGFAIKNLSVLYRDEFRNRKQAHHFDYGAEGGGAAGPAGTNGVIGGVEGRCLAMGPPADCAREVFIAAGPILESLRGERSGMEAGIIAGALIRMGMPGVQATRYEVRLRLGGILLCVLATTPAELMQAKFIFHGARASDLVVVAGGAAPTVFAMPSRTLPSSARWGFFSPPTEGSGHPPDQRTALNRQDDPALTNEFYPIRNQT